MRTADGALASVFPGPVPDAVRYEIRHGFGYTEVRHTALGLEVTEATEAGCTVAIPTFRGDLTREVDLIEEVAVKNVQNSIDQIRKDSPILKEMEDKGEISIAGAIYDVTTGAVEFL